MSATSDPVQSNLSNSGLALEREQLTVAPVGLSPKFEDLNLIYDNSSHTLAFDHDNVGREYLRLRHELRLLVEQASVSELQSIIRMLIRSGHQTEESIRSQLVDQVGWFMCQRFEHALFEGLDELWADHGERLYLMDE